MTNKNLYSILLLLLLITSNISQSLNAKTPYAPITYSQALEKLEKLVKEDTNNLLNLSYAETNYEGLSDTKCNDDTSSAAGQTKPCKFPILKITNWDQNTIQIRSLPQVLFVGGIHGDEVVGIYTLIYLVEYLKNNYDDQNFKSLMNNRLIIIVPFANPNGFSYNTSYETLPDNVTQIDPAVDFNFENSNCMNSSTARFLDQIYRSHLIISTLIFNNHGPNAIGLPWFHDEGLILPDKEAYNQIGEHLTKIANLNQSTQSISGMANYEYKSLTQLFGKKAGSFEDWSYGASWNNSKLQACKPKTAYKYYQEAYNQYTNRSFTISISPSKDANPTTLGTVQDVSDLSIDNPHRSAGSETDGHVSRNIRICIEYIKLVSPYFMISNLNLEKTKSKFIVKYKGGGCFKVSYSNVKWLYFNPSKDTSFSYNNYWNSSSVKSAILPNDKKDGALTDPANNIEANFIVNESKVVSLRLTITCDWNWTKNSPESHLVQTRVTKLNEYQAIKSNGYFLPNFSFMNYDILQILPDRMDTYVYDHTSQFHLNFMGKNLQFYTEYNDSKMYLEFANSGKLVVRVVPSAATIEAMKGSKLMFQLRKQSTYKYSPGCDLVQNANEFGCQMDGYNALAINGRVAKIKSNDQTIFQAPIRPVVNDRCSDDDNTPCIGTKLTGNGLVQINPLDSDECTINIMKLNDHDGVILLRGTFGFKYYNKYFAGDHVRIRIFDRDYSLRAFKSGSQNTLVFKRTIKIPNFEFFILGKPVKIYTYNEDDIEKLVSMRQKRRLRQNISLITRRKLKATPIF